MPGENNQKPPGNGLIAPPKRILVTLEDFTSNRGESLMQDIYAVVIGFKELSFKDDDDQLGASRYRGPNEIYSSPVVTPNTKLLKTESLDTSAYFYSWLSPVYSVKREQKFQLHTCLPLYEGQPNSKVSIYLGFFSGNWRTLPDFAEPKPSPETVANLNRNRLYDKYVDRFKFEAEKQEPKREGYALSDIREITPFIRTALDELNDAYDKADKSAGPPRDAADAQRVVAAPDCGKAVQWLRRDIYKALYAEGISKEIDKKRSQLFQYLIKKWELLAIANNHNIRYTNVFTFRDKDYWLEGDHRNWGDHRLDLTLDVRVED